MSLLQIVEFHTKLDSVPLFDIFLHRKRNDVIKHDLTQAAVAHDWLNQSSWNKYGHAAKVTTDAPVYINELLLYQFVHRKISTLTFGTNLVYMYIKFNFYLQEEQLIFICITVPVLSPLMTIYCIAARAFLFLLTEVCLILYSIYHVCFHLALFVRSVEVKILL